MSKAQEHALALLVSPANPPAAVPTLKPQGGESGVGTAKSEAVVKTG